MNQNVYAAPNAALVDVNQGNPTVDATFYVVAPRKFLVLYFATVGVYPVYWMYKHWKQYKIKTQKNITPALRAAFGLFFYHSLFGKINERKTQIGDQGSWSHGWHATVIVLLYIASPIADWLFAKSIGRPGTDIFSLVFLLPIGLLCLKAQEYANITCGDLGGQSNSRFSGANIVWIVLGLILWVLVAIKLVTGK